MPILRATIPKAASPIISMSTIGFEVADARLKGKVGRTAAKELIRTFKPSTFHLPIRPLPLFVADLARAVQPTALSAAAEVLRAAVHGVNRSLLAHVSRPHATVTPL
ncbi:hypothetical protein KM043_014449 [Ampulex compressa]|nr:hypothetical protein KM043_014449 [Ampulex compressa]